MCMACGARRLQVGTTPSPPPVLSVALPCTSQFPWATLAYSSHLSTWCWGQSPQGTPGHQYASWGHFRAFCDPDSLGQKHQETKPSCCPFPVCLAHAHPSSTGVADPRGRCGWKWHSAGQLSLLEGGALASSWFCLRLPQVHQDQGEAIRVPDRGDRHSISPACSSELWPGGQGRDSRLGGKSPRSP